MMRVLLLAAAAMAKKYEECHLYRSAVIARERGHRRLLPKPITTKPRKPKNSITFLVVSRARSGTDWLRAMLNDHRRVCTEDEAVGDPVPLRDREQGSLGAMGAGQWTGQFRTRPHALLDVRGLASVEEWER